ncbi:hypothetical protein [Mesobacillus harenae]|uniref:hypothetical protein n=1 Tax=Mesobacillus harenae TaxID=2213203 RepID=UPI0018D75CA4|nr:hypothetical protein [Mesobacillus harenae]
MAQKSKTFLQLLSKNVKKSMGPGKFEANGIKVQCVLCGCDTFSIGRAQLNTAFLSFLNLDFANRSAETLTCEHCGYIHWFGKGVKRIYT